MRRDEQKFTEKGTRIVAIALGTPDERAEFLERFGPYPFPIFSDPGRDAYVAYGLARGTLAQVVFNPAVIQAGIAAFQEGHKIGPIHNDPYQLAGTFAVDTSGIVRFSHPGRLSSDFPPNDAVLAAL